MTDKKENMNCSDLADRLRYLMKTLNLRQKDFAEACRVSDNYISMLVNGRRRNISEPLCRLICQTWGISEQWLRSGSGKPFLDEETAAAGKLRERLTCKLEHLDSDQLERLLELVE